MLINTAPRAATGLQLQQLANECQAVRCPLHNLVVDLAITSPGAKRPAAEPLPGRHRQPAHTAPARLRRHEVKLAGRSDIAAVAGGERGGPRGGRLAARSAAAATQVSNFAGRRAAPSQSFCASAGPAGRALAPTAVGWPGSACRLPHSPA